jgi:hypothetical protein
MANPNISLNLPSRKSKNLIVHFGCMTTPFYKMSSVAPEGAAVKMKSGAGDEVELAAAGSSTTGVIGFLAQEVYDPSVLGELSGYEFLNNTKAKIGDPVGVVTGQGYVLTKNYTGEVAVGDKLYPAASGRLSASQTSSDMSVGTAEEAGSNGASLIRVRVNFSLI